MSVDLNAFRAIVTALAIDWEPEVGQAVLALVDSLVEEVNAHRQDLVTNALEDEVSRLRASVALHQPAYDVQHPDTGRLCCCECDPYRGWPCPTVRAASGETGR